MNSQAALAATEDRRRSTGESHQALHSLLPDPTGALTIPAPRCAEQARLETAVFLQVCRAGLGGLSEHPLGIVRVRPEPDQLTLRLLDEPYVIQHWADLLPRLGGDSDDPRDRVAGVTGLRYRREGAGICCYRLGEPSRILLTGFNPRWWERIVASLEDHSRLFDEPDWTPAERAAYTAGPFVEAGPLFSPLLRRIRVTAGPGPINSTDAWRAVKGYRLETTDGPPCPDLIRLVGDGPTGMGWEVCHKWCTCLCEHIDSSCNIDFRDPATGLFIYYSNLKWGRTDTAPLLSVEDMNRAAFRR